MVKKTKKRYVQVGVGGRSLMFAESIYNDHSKDNELVAICDSNSGRLQTRTKLDCCKHCKTYLAADFDLMIEEMKPDVVIVTTADYMHDEYICRAMELGCDAVTEKPMTTDAQKTQRIIDTQRRTGRKCTVTFNYRYAPPRSQVKDLLMSGAIGEVHSVDFQWLLNTFHGADYFRRWHRDKANSGGLLVHKSTHHFDLVNWWLSAVPESVSAMGTRRFYTPRTADRFGLHKRTERCSTCPHMKKCAFSLDLKSKEELKAIYLDNEAHDGYFRDRCVFSDQINIEDTMGVLVKYNTGAQLTYSLNAYCAWEGFIVNFNGTKGRLEHRTVESSYINADGSVPGELVADQTYIRVYPTRDEPYQPELWTGSGGHGGGDPIMLSHLFTDAGKDDQYQRPADHRSGAYSILTGIAANESLVTRTEVDIADLVENVGYPEYTLMPRGGEPLQMFPITQQGEAKKTAKKATMKTSKSAPKKVKRKGVTAK